MGANWVAAKDIHADRSVEEIITEAMSKKYPGSDFDVCIVCKDPVTEEFFVFIPDIPHLTDTCYHSTWEVIFKNQSRDLPTKWFEMQY